MSLPSVSAPRPKVCEHQSCLLSAVKAFRNGAVYGGSVRFFHSLAFGALFKSSSFKTFKEFAQYVSSQTYHQAVYVGLYSLIYKLIFCLFCRLFRKRSKYFAFVAGAVSGLLVFWERNNLKYHILLFLMARNLAGVSEFIFRKMKLQKTKLFPLLSAVCCGATLFLFEDDKSVLNPSLTKSLRYMIKDSDKKESNWNLGTNDFGVYLERTLVI